jgi:hypothetical protein
MEPEIVVHSKYSAGVRVSSFLSLTPTKKMSRNEVIENLLTSHARKLLMVNELTLMHAFLFEFSGFLFFGDRDQIEIRLETRNRYAIAV